MAVNVLVNKLNNINVVNNKHANSPAESKSKVSESFVDVKHSTELWSQMNFTNRSLSIISPVNFSRVTY